MTAEGFDKLYNTALKLLSYRPRSEKEIIDRLNIKYQKSNIKNLEGIIDEVILRLKEQSFIDDEEFVRWWIEQRTNFKPRSLRLIKMELKQKGISKILIEKMINDKGLMINDLDNAKKLVEKRLPRYKSLLKEKAYEKLERFLSSKGFNWDTIKKSIDEVLEERV